MEGQKIKPWETLQILHSVISQKGLKTNPEACYLLYPNTNTDIVASIPFHWIGLGSKYGLCFLKGLSMFLHNIFTKILLHPGPSNGFVLAVHTDCVS